MENLVNRRNFLKSCGAGAAAITLGDWMSPQADASDRIRYSYPRNGFTNGERRIIHGAMNLLARHLTTDRVRNLTYQMSRRASLYGPYSQQIGLPRRNDWVLACMRYQLEYYLRRAMPLVQIYPGYQRSAAAAWAQVGIVRTDNITQRTGRTSGNFQIIVNRYALRERRIHDPAVWAGVIAHEMMHNLGHQHGHGEYGEHLQINAIQRSVVTATSPANRRADFSQLIPNGFCGGIPSLVEGGLRLLNQGLETIGVAGDG